MRWDNELGEWVSYPYPELIARISKMYHWKALAKKEEVRDNETSDNDENRES